MDAFWIVFIPIFFAMDPIGLLPIFYGLTEGLNPREIKKIIWQSLITATLVAYGFMLAGRAVFQFLGITMGDFMVAGGVILFCLAMMELLVGNKPKELQRTDIGAVPLGTPLIVGPAVLTMALMLVSEHGLVLTMTAIGINIAIVAAIFFSSAKLMSIIGKDGAKAVSKVMALLLAAIGVMMIRRGINAILLGGPS